MSTKNKVKKAYLRKLSHKERMKILHGSWNMQREYERAQRGHIYYPKKKRRKK